ncbi:Hypothetical predicted protein [Octopus vulgaris]|uniref:VWFA domain-containing protein n=1 Tax=Octopus vulgaris TaxID=6645 RepID=A0AA36AUV5_OCTVU|nr:Hypothetical predicted protein [Octopus vulgaris]
MIPSKLYIPLLSALLAHLSWHRNVAERIPPRFPNKSPVDLVFMLDSSASIWPPNFRKQLAFVEYMAEQLDVGLAPRQVRVGVLSFSTDARIHFNLSESNTKEILKSRLDTIKQIRGNTNISQALLTMKDELFSPENGGRRNVKKIGIMMTDGTSQNVTATQIAAEKCREENITLFVIGIGRKVDYHELVRIASKPTERYLKLSSTYAALDVIKSDVIHNVIEDEWNLPYAMGLNEKPTEVRSSKTDEKPLELVSGGKPSTVVEVDPGSGFIPEFPSPLRVKEDIVSGSGKGQKTPTDTRVRGPNKWWPQRSEGSGSYSSDFDYEIIDVGSGSSSGFDPEIINVTDVSDYIDMDVSEEPACQNKKVDILFLLDSSSSIRDVNLKKQINVVSLMIRRFDVGPHKTQVGVSIYSHQYIPIFKIGQLRTKTEILYNMKKIIFIGGGTKTGKALEKVRTEAFNMGRKRPDAGKILFVFTDGQSSDYEKTREEAYLLKKSGVRIFVVSIGLNIDPVEIRDIASEPSKEFIHNEATFDAVMQSTEILTRKTCAAPMQITPKDQTFCNATQPTDVIFMISRNRFGQWKTNKILQAASEIIKRLGAGGPFQIGITFDECPANQDISVGSIDDTNELIERMKIVQSRPLSSMFRRIHEDIFSSGGSYSSTGGDARKVAFVFIDSTVELHERDLSDEIKKVLLDGISVYAVAIGEDIHMPLLYRHIAKGDNVIKVHSYDTLEDSLPSRFTSRICTRTFSSAAFSL